jgi:hypothetical protein
MKNGFRGRDSNPVGLDPAGALRILVKIPFLIFMVVKNIS